MPCLEDIVKNLKFQSEKIGESDSLIVFGVYTGQSPEKNVVLKLTHEINDDEKKLKNDLEVERDIYMFVKDKLSLLTPHFAKGLEIGTCKLSSLFRDPTNKFFNKQLRQKWETSRGLAIYLELDRATSRSYLIEFGKTDPLIHPMTKEQAQERFLRFYTWMYNMTMAQTIPNERVHFVMTERLQGMSLSDFIRSDQFKHEDALSFDTSLAVQVAQGLCAAEKNQFIHNDLHTGNIFIHKKQKSFQTKYKFPFEFSHETDFEMKIFDYNFSFVVGGKENTYLTNSFCRSMGICSKFQKNYDWYYFLHVYVAAVGRKTVLSELIRNTKIYGLKGRACACEEIDYTQPVGSDHRCKKCTNDREEYEKFISPEEFLKSQASTNIKITTPEDDVKQVTRNVDNLAVAANRRKPEPSFVNPSIVQKAYDKSKYNDPLTFLESYHAEEEQKKANKERARKLAENEFYGMKGMTGGHAEEEQKKANKERARKLAENEFYGGKRRKSDI